MSPLIAERHGEFVLAVGGSGGPRIISAVLQAVTRCGGRLGYEGQQPECSCPPRLYGGRREPGSCCTAGAWVMLSRAAVMAPHRPTCCPTPPTCRLVAGGESLFSAVASPRLHHQLAPDAL